MAETTTDPGCPVSGMQNSWGTWLRASALPTGSRRTARPASGAAPAITTRPSRLPTSTPSANIAPFAPTFRFNDVAFEDPYRSAGSPIRFRRSTDPRFAGRMSISLCRPLCGGVRERLPHPADHHLEPDTRTPGRPDWVLKAAYQATKGTYLSQAIVREINPAIYIPGQSTEAIRRRAGCTRISSMSGGSSRGTTPTTTPCS